MASPVYYPENEQLSSQQSIRAQAISLSGILRVDPIFLMIAHKMQAKPLFRFMVAQEIQQFQELSSITLSGLKFLRPILVILSKFN